MKNRHFPTIIIIFAASIFVSLFGAANTSANHIGEFYRDITFDINCDACIPDDEREITIQLFADGEPVDGTEAVLNKETGYSVTYTDLDVFRDDKSAEEIEYKVGVLEEGTYRGLDAQVVDYETEQIDEWVSVLPENIQPGHSYVLLTDNWNYHYNYHRPHVLMNGDIDPVGVNVDGYYRIIDGKKSYYTLTSEPAENTLWTISEVPSDIDHYDVFKDYYVLTNEEGKKLALGVYDDEDDPGNFNTYWRDSDKDGFISYINAKYTNKVNFIPIEGTRGRFYIATKSLYDLEDEDVAEPDRMYYVGVGSSYRIKTQTVPEFSAQFIAFEHITREVKIASNMVVTANLCSTDNPSTIDAASIYSALATISLIGVAFVIKKNK